MFTFLITVRRELTVAYRQRIEYFNPILLFLLISLLFPLTITADPKELTLMGPGIIWIGFVICKFIIIRRPFQCGLQGWNTRANSVESARS